MVSNKIVQSLWIGDELSKIEILTIMSFISNGHDFHLYTYNDIKNIPNTVIMRDANEIIPADQIFKDSINSWASFADWFRYRLLYIKGGWWTDLDVICVKHLAINFDYCFAMELCPVNGTFYKLTTNCLIKSPAGAEYLGEMLSVIEKGNLQKVEWGSFGPRFLHRVLELYDSTEYIMEPHVFCPVNWHEIELFFKDNILILSENTFTIHLWNEIWKRNSINKNSSFHHGCMIEFYKAKFGVV